MPPQEGKSIRVSKVFPLWLLIRNPDARIAIASYEAGIARRWGRYIRNAVREHPELGLAIREDTAAAHEWQLDGHEGGVYTVGIGGALTGRPVDGVLIIDDPLKGRAEADSETYRNLCIDWWQETASTRLAPGTPVVGIMTRWHEDDLCGHLTSTDPRWKLINIPAQAEANDPLGRQPGEWLVSARGRTDEEWEQIRVQVGSRGFNALYQGRPAPAEGGIFKRGWWGEYPFAPMTRIDGSQFIPGCDEMVISVDCTFKDTDGSDFVVMQVWGRAGRKARLVDQVRDRMDFPATLAAFEQLCARWPDARTRLVEDKANGPAVISMMRKKVGGIIPITPKDSKLARASAVAPFVEAGDVELPQPSWAPWVGGFVEECAAFPNGAHDDQVDAMTQALDRLLGSGTGLRGFMARVRSEKAA